MSIWSYSRCPDCPNDHTQVFPSGPLDADIMLVGEGPGHWEDETGIPFCGNAGKELDYTYLRLAGLFRDRVFVTNCVQCRQERNGVDVRPAKGLVSTCSRNHLWEEIATVSPRIIILCGATAASLVPGHSLEVEHGIPFEVEDCAGLGGWSGTVVLMYHPAAGLHETRFMIPMLEDWERFGRWLRGRPVIQSEDEAGIVWFTDYALLETINDFTRYVDNINAVIMNAIDTENDEDRPWSLQFSHTRGTARMILAANTTLIRLFAEWARECSSEWYFHFDVHDLNVLDRLGVYLDRHTCEIHDTMRELYHLGNMPQGLKAAAYRALGARMKSYDEVVTPYSRGVLADWLAEALVQSDTMADRTVHPIGKGCPVCGKGHKKERIDVKAHPSAAVIRRIMGKLDEPESEYDPWAPPKREKGTLKPRLIGREWLPELESVCGRMPRRSIVHAPLNEAVEYGCSDADHTLRLAWWLWMERERIMKNEWRVG